MTRIYFCGSIKGGRQLASTYEKIIGILKTFGEVLTEHVGLPYGSGDIDGDLSGKEIHDRDMQWIRESDVIIAEVTLPSLGVGYEIGRAVELKKPILCLFDATYGIPLSSMISGSEGVDLHEYTGPDSLVSTLADFISRHAPGRTS
jgi:nucleoside 2-deoxyribosyltransferase